MVESGHKQGLSKAQAEQKRSAELEKRDPELRRLGRNPTEALFQWKRLKPDEQTRVQFYMMGAFDVSFALHFKEEANKSGRPELTHSVTNSRDSTPESLKAKGYQLRSTFGNCEIWVNPVGREVWRLPSPTAAAPGPAPGTPVTPGVPQPTPGQIHGDIAEARLYVGEMSAEKDGLVAKATDLIRRKGAMTAQEYAQK